MKINRRQFVRNLGLGTASLSMGSLISTSSCAPSGDSRDKRGKVSDDDQFLFIGDDIAIAQTEYGKVQGYLLNHVYTFLGVPYGADTSGKNRFMPPQKPEPWTDRRFFMGIRRRNVWRTGGPIITELLPIIGTTGM